VKFGMKRGRKTVNIIEPAAVTESAVTESA